MTNSHKPWWMYRHLRPLWGLLLSGYGLRRPFIAPVLPALLVGVIGFARGPHFAGQGTSIDGRIAVALAYAIGMYVAMASIFLTRRDAAKRKQQANRRD